jgi:hypothetical protein
MSFQMEPMTFKKYSNEEGITNNSSITIFSQQQLMKVILKIIIIIIPSTKYLKQDRLKRNRCHCNSSSVIEETNTTETQLMMISLKMN